MYYHCYNFCFATILYLTIAATGKCFLLTGFEPWVMEFIGSRGRRSTNLLSHPVPRPSHSTNQACDLGPWSTGEMGPHLGNASAKKCYILRRPIRNGSAHFYSLENHILQQVTCSPYLGVTLSDNLKWTTRINNQRTQMLRWAFWHNLRCCPQDCRKTAYIFWIDLVWSRLQLHSLRSSPARGYWQTIEGIQRRAARFIT